MQRYTNMILAGQVVSLPDQSWTYNLGFVVQALQDGYGLLASPTVVDWLPGNFDHEITNVPFIGTGIAVIGAGIEGAFINTNIRLLLQSIKVAGAYCRGEQELAQTELHQSLAIALSALQGGFVRGAAIKLLQTLTGSNVVAALGFVACTEAIPVLLRVMQNELSVEQAMVEVGPKVFTSGVITVVLLLFPQLGTLLFGATVVEAIWQELPPVWQANLQQTFNAAISSPWYRPASS